MSAPSRARPESLAGPGLRLPVRKRRRGLPRRNLPDDPAAFETRHPVAETVSKGSIVGCYQDGHTVFTKAVKQAAQTLLRRSVHSQRWLVEQEQVRFRHDYGRDGRSLPFAGGEIAGIVAGDFVEAEFGEQLFRQEGGILTETMVTQGQG